MNGEGYRYWRARDRKPVTTIKWPLSLLSDGVKVHPVDPPQKVLQVQPLTVSRKPEKQVINITKAPGGLDITAKPTPTRLVMTPKKG
jgi:hypothetical protein